MVTKIIDQLIITGSAIENVAINSNDKLSIVVGTNNTLNTSCSLVFGSNNTLNSNGSIIFGNNHSVVEGERNMLIGTSNSASNSSKEALIVGQGNQVNNWWSATIGANNINNGSSTLVVGNAHKMTNATSCAIGNTNFSTQANTYLIGFFLSASKQYQAFVGQYNDATSTPDGAPDGLLFGVGGGDSNQRKTVFAITRDQNGACSMRIPHNISDPTGAGNTLTTGSMYYDTTNDRIRIWNGSAWRTIATT